MNPTPVYVLTPPLHQSISLTFCPQNHLQVWSWGVNDNAALGRQTAKVPNPNGEGFLSSDDLEMTPAIITKLAEEGFRAVRVAGGDSVSVAISDAGQMKVWGSFRVSVKMGCRM